MASDSDAASLIARSEFPGRKKGGISSLQVASSFARSVASLSLLLNNYLPGLHNLHCKVFADHQFH
jgi:hypothetical protein